MALNSASGKALWVVPVPEFGGVARHVVDVARAGLPGYELYVLAPTGALTRELTELGIKVLADDGFGTDAGFKSSFRALDRAIDQVKPDVVHAHLAYADIVAAAVVNSRKVRKLKNRDLWVPQLATSEHGIADNGSVYNSNRVRALVMKALHFTRLQATDTKIAVSASTAEQMKIQWGARNVHVVKNGVDVEATRKAVSAVKVDSGSAGPRILSLSRLSEEKGLDILIDAFALFKQSNPEAELEIAGKGDLLAQLQSQVSQLGLEGSVSFPGFVNPTQAMGRNDMIVQLSVWENLSYTLLDAKAAGLKVVATDVGGNSEIVSTEELVPALSRLDREVAVEVVASTIAGVWGKETIPGTELSTPQQMCEEIVNIYRKGR